MVRISLHGFLRWLMREPIQKAVKFFLEDNFFAILKLRWL